MISDTLYIHILDPVMGREVAKIAVIGQIQ